MLTVALRGPVALVPGLSLAQKYADKRRQFPHLPEPAQLVRELNTISRGAGIPASIDDRKNWLRLYTQSGCLGVRPTRHGDAYSIEFVEPMSLRNHGALARSRLRLTGASWIYYGQLRDVPPGCRVPDAEIRTNWQRSQTPDAKPPPRTPSRYDAFCDALDLVIEGGRQIEAAKDPAERILSYYEVRSTGEVRRSAAGVYHFLLSRPGAVQAGAMVQLQNEPDLRGRVRAIDGERLTVAFDTAVDRRRILERGELVVAANDVVQRVQADAVAKLRARTTLNSRLPAVLVDGAFLGYREQVVESSEPLDDNQQTALQRALSVPDLLCVVGPPGTGKTRTIVEIARAAAARGDRVLIASQTNTAVDNVIERLPASMTAIRVGNDERISEAVRHRTLGAAAGDLQQRIADRTAVTAQRLDPWSGEPSLAARWLNRIGAELAASEDAIQARDVALRERQAASDAVTRGFGGPLRASEAFLWEIEQGAEKLTGEIRRIEARLHQAQARANGLVGFWHRRTAERCRTRLNELVPRATQKRAEEESARQEYELQRAQLERTVGADPAVRAAADRAEHAEAAARRSDGLARQAAQQLARLLAGVEVAPAPEPDIAAFVSWCQAYMPVLHDRAALLLDWRNQLEQPSEQLHAELLQYADVIGSTCIGVGVQRNRLADLDFDLVVVDEAGQIPLPSTLVPLTRARRAVLVGDHHQLPPFVDDDVRQWLARRGDRDMDVRLVGELLTHSAFERLLDRAPQSNRVLLDWQRRMPSVVADFVSERFYGGQLKTGERDRPPPAVFRSPLAIVDTSGMPAAERAERRRERSESWLAAGCDNQAEAAIVVRLVQRFATDGCDWAVIAPYKAQVQLIGMRLQEMLGAEAVRDRVGTVDTFQGQERDIIIFSFTRSNPGRSVGFLGELRRLNVAMTRARHQLILVGDRSTLVRARDVGFREMAGELFRYADGKGDVVPSSDLWDRLR